MLLRALSIGLVLVSTAFAAIPPLVSGQEYTFDGYLVIKSRAPKGFSVWLSAHPDGEIATMPGRQDFELAPSKAFTAARLLSTAKSVGGDKKVEVRGHAGAKSVLKPDAINPAMPRVEHRPAQRMLRLRVEGVRIEGKNLLVTVLPNPCVQPKDLVVRTSPPAESDPVQATLWVEEPQRECMLAVMPSPHTLTVDLTKQFPGVKRLSLSVESSAGDSFNVDWRM